MTPPLDDATLRELAPLHAVDALAGDERAAFEAALATRPWLQEEVASYRAVTDALLTADRVAPDPALRDRVLARLAATPQPAAAHSEGPHTEGPHTEASPSAAPRPALAVVRGDAPRPGGVRRVVAPLLAAGLAAALVAVVSLRRQADDLRTRLVATERRASAVRDTLAARDRTLDALLGRGRELLVVNLGTRRAAEPGVQFLWNVASRTGVLRAYGLPRAPRGRQYQLWLIERGRPLPMPVFDADAGGRALVTGIPMPASLDGIQAIAVTVEPTGGSPAPSSTPILVGSVAGTD